MTMGGGGEHGGGGGGGGMGGHGSIPPGPQVWGVKLKELRFEYLLKSWGSWRSMFWFSRG